MLTCGKASAYTTVMGGPVRSLVGRPLGRLVAGPTSRLV